MHRSAWLRLLPLNLVLSSSFFFLYSFFSSAVSLVLVLGFFLLAFEDFAEVVEVEVVVGPALIPVTTLLLTEKPIPPRTLIP